MAFVSSARILKVSADASELSSIAIVRADVTRAQIKQIFAAAIERDCHCVCVNFSLFDAAYYFDTKASLKFVSTIAFPLGAMDSNAKHYKVGAKRVSQFAGYLAHKSSVRKFGTDNNLVIQKSRARQRVDSENQSNDMHFPNFPNAPGPAEILALIEKWPQNSQLQKEFARESRLTWTGQGQRPKNWLGSFEVLAALVKAFVEECLKRGDEFALEEDNTKDHRDALELAQILLGRDKNFCAVTGWNTPGGIDRHISETISGGHVRPDETVAIFLEGTIQQIKMMAMVPSQSIEDREALVTGSLDFAVSVLAGISVPEDDDMD